MLKLYSHTSLRRKRSVRSKLYGTAVRPRLSVFRSSGQIYAQAINDQDGKTLAQANSLRLKAKGTKLELASLVGKAVAEDCLKRKITKVVFDRGPYKYHGRVKALADAARTAGLQF